jgi:hypothetical protein
VNVSDGNMEMQEEMMWGGRKKASSLDFDDLLSSLKSRRK